MLFLPTKSSNDRTHGWSLCLPKTEAYLALPPPTNQQTAQAKAYDKPPLTSNDTNISHLYDDKVVPIDGSEGHPIGVCRG